MNQSLPPKRRGELAELAFHLKAAQLGLIVARPWGDSLPLDCIVLHGARASRVQIKAATRLSAGRAFYSVPVKRSLAGRAASYTARDIDFLVVYIAPEDAWYIFPPWVFARRKSLKIHPWSRTARRRFRAYRERWQLLLDPDSPGLTLHACADICPPHARPLRRRQRPSRRDVARCVSLPSATHWRLETGDWRLATCVAGCPVLRARFWRIGLGGFDLQLPNYKLSNYQIRSRVPRSTRLGA